MHDMPFGQLLKQLRKDYGLTQEDFAEQVGCSIETISKIERGERRPSKQVAERMAQVLDVPVAERAAFVRMARLLSRSAEEHQEQETRGHETGDGSLSIPSLPSPVSQSPGLPVPPARTAARSAR